MLLGKSADKPLRAAQGGAGNSVGKLNFRRLWQGTGWLMVAVVVWASLTDHPPEPPSLVAWDKAQHFIAYAVLMFWYRQAFAHHWRWPLFLVLLGIGLEILQTCTELRTAEPFDMVANTLGVGIGLLLASTPLGTLLAAVDARLKALRS
jgi:VanZ family protein